MPGELLGLFESCGFALRAAGESIYPFGSLVLGLVLGSRQLDCLLGFFVSRIPFSGVRANYTYSCSGIGPDVGR